MTYNYPAHSGYAVHHDIEDEGGPNAASSSSSGQGHKKLKVLLIWGTMVALVITLVTGSFFTGYFYGVITEYNVVTECSSNPQWSNTAVSNFDAIDHTSEFRCWANTHNKVYSSQKEQDARLATFKDNWKKIVEHNNNKDRISTLKINEFADMTTEEFVLHITGGTGSCIVGLDDKGYPATTVEVERVGGIHVMTSDATSLPNSIDWTDFMPGVKNQGRCGSCWAFSATGAVEGRCNIAQQKKGSDVISLAEQTLVDCDTVDQGCNGGLMDNAFAFYEKSGGDCSENDYPYTGTQGTCQISKCTTECKVTGYQDVAHNETELMDALQTGPVSVAVAVTFAFQFYHGGVFDNHSCVSKELNHGVIAVGYGTTSDGTNYWRVRNSWGASWGDSGYINMIRASSDKDLPSDEGECGILKAASYPVIGTTN